MSRQPDRARSRKVVLVVALFLTTVVVFSDEECARPAPPAAAGLLVTLAPLPRTVAAIGRVLLLFSSAAKEIEGECPPGR